MTKQYKSAQDIRSRIGQLRSELGDLEKALPEMMVRELGLAPDMMLVEADSYRGRKGGFVRLTGTGERRKPSARVRLVKADGTLGNREAVFFCWEKESDVQ